MWIKSVIQVDTLRFPPATSSTYSPAYALAVEPTLDVEELTFPFWMELSRSILIAGVRLKYALRRKRKCATRLRAWKDRTPHVEPPT